MKKYTKNYIGHANQVVTKAGKELPIVKMTLSLEKLQEIAHEWNEKEYVSFEVALLTKPDDYGHTHTVYSTIVDEVEDTPKPEATENPAPRRRGRPTNAERAQREAEAAAATQTEDLPF